MRDVGGTSLCLQRKTILCRSSGTTRHGASCTICMRWGWLGQISFLLGLGFLSNNKLNYAFTSLIQVYELQASWYHGSVPTTFQSSTSSFMWQFLLRTDVPQGLTGNHNFCPVNYENTDSSKSGKVRTSPVHIFQILVPSQINYLPDWALLAAGSISQDMTGTRDAIINNIHLFTFNDIALNPSTCLINSSSASVFLGSASAANGAAFAFHALR